MGGSSSPVSVLEIAQVFIIIKMILLKSSYEINFDNIQIHL